MGGQIEDFVYLRFYANLIAEIDWQTGEKLYLHLHNLIYGKKPNIKKSDLETTILSYIPKCSCPDIIYNYLHFLGKYDDKKIQFLSKHLDKFIEYYNKEMANIDTLLKRIVIMGNIDADNQHVGLIKLINFYKKLLENNIHEYVIYLYDMMLIYLRKHFMHEEKLSKGNVLFLDHMLEHQKLLDFLISKKERISLQPEELDEYLHNHLKDYDYQFYNNIKEVV